MRLPKDYSENPLPYSALSISKLSAAEGEFARVVLRNAGLPQ